MNFSRKKFTTWTDETKWGSVAVENGLVYGVWDNELNKCVSYAIREEFGVITTIGRAREVANILNEREESKKDG